MGTTKEDIKIFVDLHKNGILDFSKKLSIADMGTSQLHYTISGKVGTMKSDKFEEFEDSLMSDVDFLKSVFESLGKSETSLDGYYSGMLAQKFYTDLGFDYIAIDLDTYNDSSFVLKLDLNEEHCPSEHKGKHDLVVNHGTTEHLINQTNAFRIIHDLCKVNGVMVTTVPCFDINHGFFNYSPIFFRCLARANNYEIISHHIQNVYSNGEFQCAYNFSVMRKTSEAEFVQPSQVFESGIYNRDLSDKILYPRDDVIILT